MHKVSKCVGVKTVQRMQKHFVSDVALGGQTISVVRDACNADHQGQMLWSRQRPLTRDFRQQTLRVRFKDIHVYQTWAQRRPVSPGGTEKQFASRFSQWSLLAPMLAHLSPAAAHSFG